MTEKQLKTAEGLLSRVSHSVNNAERVLLSMETKTMATEKEKDDLLSMHNSLKTQLAELEQMMKHVEKDVKKEQGSAKKSETLLEWFAQDTEDENDNAAFSNMAGHIDAHNAKRATEMKTRPSSKINTTGVCDGCAQKSVLVSECIGECGDHFCESCSRNLWQGTGPMCEICDE